MSRVVVNVLEVNRRRHVELESITLALAEAVAAGDRQAGEVVAGVPDALDPVRELLRALRELITRPLPEALLSTSAELAAELAAPAHELDAIADELEAIDADDPVRLELEQLADRLRHRALTRS